MTIDGDGRVSGKKSRAIAVRGRRRVLLAAPERAPLEEQLGAVFSVLKAVQGGDFSARVNLGATRVSGGSTACGACQGILGAIESELNDVVSQLQAVGSEIVRVSREVGTKGRLGGQAEVPGVAGTWKDLTDNVNVMASNLTSQVRGIAKVVNAVPNGDLRQELALEAKGEIAALAGTINDMTRTLRVLAEQVTSVAREVGIEGRLGGQAKVPGAAGTWRDLTDNVNRLAGNLTTQVRAIAEVATAVTKGDLTRAISVEAQGEVSELKGNINQMIENLRDTTRANREQDWLKSNLARFSGMMQGQRDLVSLARLIMSELTPLVSAQHGAFYGIDPDDETSFVPLSSYAFPDVALVLMDIMMPEVDGYEATREIRGISQFAALPILAISAKAMEGDRAKCLAAGCSDFLAKPVDNGRLLALVRQWLRRDAAASEPAGGVDAIGSRESAPTTH